MMKTRSVNPENKRWALFAVGLLVFVLGLLLRAAFPASAFNFRIVSALGILALGLGAASVVRAVAARLNPTAARRMAIEENDERAQAIRHRAGNAAYVFSLVLNALVLIIYSGVSAGRPGFDLLWWVLAALVLLPGMFFVAMQVWLGKS